MKKKTKKNKPTINDIKAFWDGPKVGFDEKLYNKYLEAKEAWRTKMN